VGSSLRRVPGTCAPAALIAMDVAGAETETVRSKQSTRMKSIHQRPGAARSRRQAGHWEGDLIIGAGQRSAIVTLVERKSCTTVLVPVQRDHTARSVGDALIGAFSAMPIGLRRTLTWDLWGSKIRPCLVTGTIEFRAAQLAGDCGAPPRRCGVSAARRRGSRLVPRRARV
jgi:hypothetical protein